MNQNPQLAHAFFFFHQAQCCIRTAATFNTRQEDNDMLCCQIVNRNTLCYLDIKEIKMDGVLIVGLDLREGSTLGPGAAIMADDG